MRHTRRTTGRGSILSRRRLLGAAMGLLATGLLATASLTACGSEAQDSERRAPPRSGRCDLCGMVVDPTSGWRAGATSEPGAPVSFDTPKCLFRYHHTRHRLRDAWVIEYYTQERRPASEMLYVLGADLHGPMGRDLVPVEGREAAERFSRDHHGERVLTFDEVTAEIAAELFRPRP